MPESDVPKAVDETSGDQPATGVTEPESAVVEVGEPVAGASEEDAGGPDAEPTKWFYYGLGLSLQTVLWFLLFLAIVVAVLVGNKLTEFRYVGF